MTPGDELTYAESHACTCPVCGMETSPMITHSGDRDVEVEMCTNPDCAVKQVKKFVHFCERDCMDIVGLSEKTLEKFIERASSSSLQTCTDLIPLSMTLLQWTVLDRNHMTTSGNQFREAVRQHLCHSFMRLAFLW